MSAKSESAPTKDQSHPN